jgi:hypothetical protein
MAPEEWNAPAVAATSLMLTFVTSFYIFYLEDGRLREVSRLWIYLASFIIGIALSIIFTNRETEFILSTFSENTMSILFIAALLIEFFESIRYRIRRAIFAGLLSSAALDSGIFVGYGFHRGISFFIVGISMPFILWTLQQYRKRRTKTNLS